MDGAIVARFRIDCFLCDHTYIYSQTDFMREVEVATDSSIMPYIDIEQFTKMMEKRRWHKVSIEGYQAPLWICPSHKPIKTFTWV